MGDLRTQPTEPFSSNALRLMGREWGAVAVLVLVLILLLPPFWARIEPFTPSTDYRIPFQSSADYWLFERYCRAVTGRQRTLLIGDSVIWGQYVAADGTLSHHLNERTGYGRFVNLGLDGTHPLALLGLYRDYGRTLEEEDVILHLNLLWLGSLETDLQTDKPVTFNHPRLIPQVRPRIPAYQASLSDRIGILVERVLPVLLWSRHLRNAYFDDLDLPRWTLEHPYTDPLGRITLELPAPAGARYPDAGPWNEGGPGLQDLPWIGPSGSLQWWAFRELVGLLQARGNRVTVLIGPLNEHMLTAGSRERYQRILESASAWLTTAGIPHLSAPLLPTDRYADLSHPLEDGYARLAEVLWAYLGGVE
jgi:hypothetical protein